jgi:hypothetical protein
MARVLTFCNLRLALRLRFGTRDPITALVCMWATRESSSRILSLVGGLRYDRDRGRTDTDLPAIPEINATFPGYGNAVKQANMNLAPQIGFAWDPRNNGKTVIRGGVGLFIYGPFYMGPSIMRT